MSRFGSFKLKLVAWFALLALLPLIVAFYGYDTLARRSETRRVDATLEAALRAAVAAYSARLDAAAARARALAAEPKVQQAMRKHDRAQLAKLLPKVPPQPAAVRTVSVISGGKVIGTVAVGVPIDDKLLGRIGGGLSPHEQLIAVQGGRVVAGRGAGTAVSLPAGIPTRVRLGDEFRALATSRLPAPPGLSLAAIAPQGRIDSATHSSERTVLAALAGSLILFGLATYLLGRSVVGTLRRLAEAADAIAGGRFGERVDARGTDEFAQLGRAFNRMASQLEARLRELEEERTRVQEAVARFGEALSATLDSAQLLRVVVESAVEATRATGGVVLGPEGELARAGDPDAGTERITLPLRVGSSDFGLLVLTGSSFDAGQVEAATSLAAQVVVALENARLHRVVERQALVDALTGLSNRRSLEESLRAELARSARVGDRLAVVLADLDDFKAVNDRFGHAAGDEVLQAFAAALRETVRESDHAGRWGGEEFALILTNTDAEGGARLAERARVAIEGKTVELPDGETVRVTASFGVASFPEWRDPDDLFAAADAALYEAKGAGKNRVVRAVESTSEEIV
ncbi:MAG TPA: diguanylate cyclase [Gaiellaceae bacterium]|nr:diguanylate cyclase [Gaiellaceae bacterium]